MHNTPCIPLDRLAPRLHAVGVRTLFLDLASHHGLLAMTTEEAVSSMRDIDHRMSDGDLVPLYTELLREVKWGQEDLTQLACVVGPGGFTSLRVAVSFINTLAFALDLPTTGIHLSDLYAARVHPLSSGPFPPQHSPLPAGEGLGVGAYWLHSTKKKELFVRGFGVFAKEFPEAKWMELEKFISIFPKGASWAGELLPEHEALVKEKDGTPLSLRSIKEVLPSFLSGQSYAKETILPWYGRMW